MNFNYLYILISMKTLILSDLHLELSDFKAPSGEVDLVVLAGDIHKGNLGIYWARQTWPSKPIVYVAGNHEFYHQDRIKTIENLRSAANEMNVHFLDNDDVIIDGVRFLGCTLWTDWTTTQNLALRIKLQRNARKLLNYKGSSSSLSLLDEQLQ